MGNGEREFYGLDGPAARRRPEVHYLINFHRVAKSRPARAPDFPPGAGALQHPVGLLWRALPPVAQPGEGHGLRCRSAGQPADPAATAPPREPVRMTVIRFWDRASGRQSAVGRLAGQWKSLARGPGTRRSGTASAARPDPSAPSAPTPRGFPDRLARTALAALAAAGAAAAAGSGATASAPANSTASPRRLTGVRHGCTFNLLF